MQLDVQEFLKLAKAAGRLYTWDIEATGLHADYNSILCISIKPYGEMPTTFRIKQPGNDKKVCRMAREMLADAAGWVTYYGKGFDVPMLEGRLLKWGLPSLVKKPHADMFFQLVHKVKTSRKSQAHLAEWLGLPEKKMTVSPDEWNQVLYHTHKVMTQTMVPRCESDVTSLEGLLDRTGHLIKNMTK